MKYPVSLLVFAYVFIALDAQAQSFRDASHLFSGRSSGILIGASAADVNSDGLVDLYHYEHLLVQRPDGTFANLSEASGLVDEGDGVFGGIFGDYSNDGFLDLFIEAITPPSYLFRNLGDGTFARADVQAGLDVQALTQGSAWGDFDANGTLDLFVGSDDGKNLLYLNEDFATFRDATAGARITLERNSYGVAAADYDRDGDLDVFIAACSGDPARSVKVLLRNDSQGRFVDVASNAGVDDDLASWGVVWADIDNDGWQDLYIANMAQGDRPGYNYLYLNDQNAGFLEIGAAAGVWGAENVFTMGVAAADFDNDGWIDLVSADQNGRLHLYRNRGDRTFAELDLDIAVQQTLAVADVNDDGWVDLYVPLQQREQLWLNEGGSHHWLTVQARGTTGNYFGVGARIDLYAGGLHQVREITAGDGMTSQNHNLEAHFGLGSATTVDSIVVRWSHGAVERVTDLPVDQEVVIVEGVGVNQAPAPFRLTQPADETVVALADETILFTWEAPADPDAAALTYTFRLMGPGVSIVEEGLTTTAFQLDADLLQTDAFYHWTVVASDGFSVRRSMDRFVLSRGTPTLVEEVPGEEVVRVTGFPNPFVSEATLRFELAHPASVETHIYDVTGRTVYRRRHGVLAAGAHAFIWDGRDAQGAVVAPGLYLVRITTNGTPGHMQTLVRLR